MSIRVVDTHTHLDEVEDLDEALTRAKRAGVIAIITMGSNHDSNRWALKFSERSRKVKVFAALGIHPWSLDPTKVDSTIRFISDNIERAVAVGEIGLDYWRKDVRKDPGKKEAQKTVFRCLLEIARDHDKPASIHSRGSWEDCLKIIEEVGLRTAVFHWFSGPSPLLEELIKKNHFISATPAATYSQEHRRAIQATPLDFLLLETDSPVKYEGEVSEPALITRSLEAVAELKGLDTVSVANKTTENARNIFDI